MILTKVHGQAWQDAFVARVLDGKRDGTYLEIGSCHPVELSNTFALERDLGWSGLQVDIDCNAVELCKAQRKGHAVCMDTTSLAFRNFLSVHYQLPAKLDYLSLDVDSASLATLKNLPHDLSFDVITMEHDRYRFGQEVADAMRMHLLAFGYILVCEDVCSSDGIPYEDWWVSQDVPPDRWAPFVSKNKPWPEIMAQAGVKVP